MQDFIVRDEESFMRLLRSVRRAQEAFSVFTQSQVDQIFSAAAAAANAARIPLAKLAVEETGMGVFEDKVLKNHYAAEYIYNRYKSEKTCGEIERDEGAGYIRVAAPVGVAAAIVPTTNPTSTAIFKALIALKTRNGIIFSPHPRAKKCTIEAAKIVLQAAIEAGAPEDIIGWIDEPSVELSALAMREADVILATGGPQMVKAAYSSGKPAIGVGAGNVPALVDETADIPLAVSSIIHSKTFDNGMICASEQSAIVHESVYDEFKAEMQKRGCYFLKGEELDKVRATILVDGRLNGKIVGRTAAEIAKMSGVEVSSETKVLVGEVTDVSKAEPFAHEKLSPVLAMYKAEGFDDGIEKADALVHGGGIGHTSAVYLDEVRGAEKLERFRDRMKTCRILVNTPAAQGGIGDLYNFRLTPSLTLGCGSWGGNSVCENVGTAQLVNVKTVAIRRENMLWLRLPEKVYFKRGCLQTAIKELGEEYGKKRAFVVTDEFLYRNGKLAGVLDGLREQNIEYSVFFEVTPDPTLACAKEGAKRMSAFAPDVVIAVGGGSPMDAAKVMWVLYEHPETKFEDMAMRFMDIRKRVRAFPKTGKKALFVALPTTAGTGSEVTPFAVITDEKTGVKYPLADYELLPDIAICDVELMKSIPPSLTANAGLDALSHAVEAVASVVATDFTNGLALEAISLLVEYLPAAFCDDGSNIHAREKVANAATMAGIAFANAFLGLCHSMAHKLGARWHLPHGMANALLLNEIIRFNSSDAPTKMGTFPQYAYPDCKKRYARIARYLGCKGETEDALIEEMLALFDGLQEKLKMPKNIKEALGERATEEDFLASVDEMSGEAFDDQCTGANPRYPLVSEIKELYLRAYYGENRKENR